jgi:hypothetical protein
MDDGGTWTTCCTVFDVEPATAAFPPYTAVMAWLPSPRLDVVNEADPLASVTVASGLLPSLNVTEPVGVPALDVTVAVNVTGCPGADGLAELVRDVVEDARTTVSVAGAEVEPLKEAFDANTAVIECVPAGSPL